MDPLSVTASVVGLVGAAAQMTTVLYSMGSDIKDAPHLTGAAVSEMNDISHVLLQLQQYIDGKTQASLSRLSLITVEHITASLTGCVITYSELDAVLKSLHAGEGMTAWDRAKFLMKKDEINAIIGRLQNHKSSFSLMLNIIQCSSMGEAERSMDDLCDKVSQLLRSNQELSMRLRNIEDGYTARKASTAAPTEVAGAAASDDSVSTTSAASGDEHVPTGDAGRISTEGAAFRPSAFEELLHRSRVYRHAERRHSQSSLVDDGRSTLAISICSSLTLGEVSKISVFALPVYATELSNPEFYRFGQAMAAASIPINSKVESGASSHLNSRQSHARDKDKRSLTAWYRDLRKKSPKPSSDPPSGPPVFGVPLTTSIRYQNVAISLIDDTGKSYIYGYIPIVVAKCGVYLKEKATETEGMFEISGSPKTIQEIVSIFDSPPRYGKGFQWAEERCNAYDAGSVLLRYLLTLPEPVIPLDVYSQFRQPIKDIPPGVSETLSEADVKELIKTYQALITSLPPLSRQLLLYLQDLLAVFASKSELNSMTTAKLAAIFQPGILAHPDHKAIPAEYRLDQDVLIFLVEYQDNFLLGMDSQNTISTTKATDLADEPLVTSDS